VNVALVPVDPYDDTTGLLFPLLLQRIRDYGNGLKFEVKGDSLAEMIGRRLIGKDPTVAAVAFCAKGKMVGHAIATVEELGGDRWVFIQQCRLDPKVDAGDAVKRAIDLATDWGRQFGATRLLFGTHRSDAAWEKKHGFTVVRKMLGREIPTQEAEGAEVA